MEWPLRARCQGLGDLFFDGPREEALRVCGLCPVRSECLEAAMEEEAGQFHGYGRFGIRGGMTPTERAHLQLKREGDEVRKACNLGHLHGGRRCPHCERAFQVHFTGEKLLAVAAMEMDMGFANYVTTYGRSPRTAHAILKARDRGIGRPLIDEIRQEHEELTSSQLGATLEMQWDL